MFDTSKVFKPGKLTIAMDGGAGSSGKAKLGAFLCENTDKCDFAINTFMSNAAHTVVTENGTSYVLQAMNSIVYNRDKFSKLYIAGGAVHELDVIIDEIESFELTPDELGIHPLVAIVQDKDIDYEAGRCDFEGSYYDEINLSANLKLGSTLHGVGAARARRILRRDDVKLARDVEYLQPYLCDVENEVMDRLDNGESGLLEIAQGFQLSYLLKQFYPKTTSRNCTVAAALDDCNIPPKYAGDVILNFRTYPIRVNNNKYLHADTQEVLNDHDVLEMRKNGQEDLIVEVKGDSGAYYSDQEELTWEEVTEKSGVRKDHPDAIIVERTSLTQLERRVFTFSKQNVIDAIRYNDAGQGVWLAVNFLNYVDYDLNEARGGSDILTKKAKDWIDNNIPEEHIDKLWLLGTGAKTNDFIDLLI